MTEILAALLRAHFFRSGDWQLSVFHASNPPAISTTLWYPARCNKLHAITLRYPPAQCTAIGLSLGRSGNAALNRSSGCQSAPSICPAWNSPSRRTSRTPMSPLDNFDASSCGDNCGNFLPASPAFATPPRRLPDTRQHLRCRCAPAEPSLHSIVRHSPRSAPDATTVPAPLPSTMQTAPTAEYKPIPAHAQQRTRYPVAHRAPPRPGRASPSTPAARSPSALAGLPARALPHD